MDKTIGILTTFYNLDSAYSLVSVVRDQLTASVKHGYKTVLFVLPSFKDDLKVPEGVEIRKIVPQIILEPYKGTNYPDQWEEDAKKVTDMLEKNMEDIDILLCHDIFFIDQYLPYNIGLRKAVEKFPNLKIFAWAHSGPSAQLQLENNPHANRYSLPNQTKIIYCNHTDVTGIAEMYGTWNHNVRVVHNTRDPRSFWNIDPFVHKLIEKYNLFEKDIISVYPLSTPRMIDGKGVDKAIKLHSKLKEIGYKTSFIVANAHANAERDRQMIRNTIFQANEWGLGDSDLIFTSMEDPPEHEAGVSPKIISDLFRLSNIFVFPTYAENCSLVLLEAMIAGNLIVLNKNTRSLEEFGKDQALYIDFNYRDNKEVNEKYYTDLAKIVGAQFLNSKPLQVKRNTIQRFNYDWIWENQIEPLFYE